MKMKFVAGLTNKIYISKHSERSTPEVAVYSAVHAYKKRLANDPDRNLKILELINRGEKTIIIVDFIVHQYRLGEKLDQLGLKHFSANGKTQKNINEYFKDYDVIIFTKHMWLQFFVGVTDYTYDKIINTVYAHNAGGLIGTAIRGKAKEFIQIVDNIPMKNVVKRLVGKLHYNTMVEVDKESLNNIFDSFNKSR